MLPRRTRPYRCSTCGPGLVLNRSACPSPDGACRHQHVQHPKGPHLSVAHATGPACCHTHLSCTGTSTLRGNPRIWALHQPPDAVQHSSVQPPSQQRSAHDGAQLNWLSLPIHCCCGCQPAAAQSWGSLPLSHTGNKPCLCLQLRTAAVLAELPWGLPALAPGLTLSCQALPPACGHASSQTARSTLLMHCASQHVTVQLCRPGSASCWC